MLYQKFDLFISRSDGGIYEWKAVASTTQRDNYHDQTTNELFTHWLRRAAMEEKSEDWLPPVVTPYLSIAHFPDGGGELAAGITTWMGIEDGKFIAKGIISDNEIGRAVIKNYDPSKNIRVSAGWWDIEHRHGDIVFRRKSMSDACPLCRQKVPKEYTDGQLVHFALTTVPVNPNTEFVLEEKSMKKKKTRYDDAAEIVGEDMAKHIVAASQAGVTLSNAEDELDAFVVRAKTKTIDGQEFDAGDFLVVEDPEKPSTWHLPVKRNGTPDHRLMGAAKAALTVGYRGNKYNGVMKEDAIKKLKALYEAEKLVWKSEVKMENVKGDGQVADNATVEGVSDAVEAGADNNNDVDVYMSDTEVDELLAEAGALDDDNADDVDMDIPAESEVVFEALEVGDKIDGIMKSEAARSDKLAAVDAIINGFAMQVRSAIEETTPVDALSVMEQRLQETQNDVAVVAKSMADIVDQLAVISQKIDDVTAKTNGGQANDVAQPVQKSMTAPVQMNPIQQMNPTGGRMSLRQIVERSVGIS